MTIRLFVQQLAHANNRENIKVLLYWPFMGTSPVTGYAPDNLCPSHDIQSCWRHQMETFSALLALCAGNSPVMRSPVNSPHKGQWHGALMFSLICPWINGWVNNRKDDYLRRHRAHYDFFTSHCFLTHLWELFDSIVHVSICEIVCRAAVCVFSTFVGTVAVFPQ